MRKATLEVLGFLTLATLAAGQMIHAEEPSAETLFAYRSSLGARLHDALTTDSVLPVDVPVELIPVDSFAFEHATLNSTMTFRIVQNVNDHRGRYGYAGTIIEAKVIRIREGRRRSEEED